jgi:hypothetical protein
MRADLGGGDQVGPAAGVSLGGVLKLVRGPMSIGPFGAQMCSGI